MMMLKESVFRFKISCFSVLFPVNLRSSYNGHPTHMKCCELRGDGVTISRRRLCPPTGGATTLQQVQLTAFGRGTLFKPPRPLKDSFCILVFQ